MITIAGKDNIAVTRRANKAETGEKIPRTRRKNNEIVNSTGETMWTKNSKGKTNVPYLPKFLLNKTFEFWRRAC